MFRAVHLDEQPGNQTTRGRGYIGPAGQAAQVKALVNMVMNSNTAALAEGLGLGQALGPAPQPSTLDPQLA